MSLAIVDPERHRKLARLGAMASARKRAGGRWVVPGTAAQVRSDRALDNQYDCHHRLKRAKQNAAEAHTRRAELESAWGKVEAEHPAGPTAQDCHRLLGEVGSISMVSA